MATNQLWPDFRVARRPAWVRNVLSQAGAELMVKTDGVVDLRVIPYQSDHPFYPFGYECQFHVPKLDFVFLLCRVLTDETGSSVSIESPSRTYKDIFDEDGFRTALGELFHSDHTQKIVQNLISMAAD